MLRNLPVFRRMSLMTVYCRDLRIFLRVFSENTNGSVRQLKRLGCIYEGGYVFRPPDGKIIGTYRDIELFRLFGFRKGSCKFRVGTEDNLK